MLRVLKAGMTASSFVFKLPLHVMTAPVLLCAAAALATLLAMLPRRTPMGPACASVLRQAIPLVVSAVQQKRNGLRSVVVSNFEHDPSGAVTQAIRDAIEGTNIMVVHPRPVLDRWRKLMGNDLGAPGFRESVDAASAAGAMAALFGTVLRHECTAALGATIELQVTLARADDGHIMMHEHVIANLQNASMPDQTGDQAMSAFGRRTLILCLLLFIGPIACLGFIERVVARRSNFATGLCLVSLGSAGALCAHLLLASDLQQGSALLVTLGSFVATSLWSALIANTKAPALNDA